MEEAKQLHLKALSIYTDKYGAHYTTALALHRYANILAEEGSVKDAVYVRYPPP